MRVAITTVQVPYISGGAELQVRGLEEALRRAGHEVDTIRMPFRFSPTDAVRHSMDVWESEQLDNYNGYRIDRVISMKFPAFYAEHKHKVVWLTHQHRIVYDLWNTPHAAELRGSRDGQAFRREVIERDKRTLATCKKVFAISRTVADRLKRFNAVDAEPLYHPPQRADRFFCAEPEAYIYYPSRFETLKRQNLLLEAMAHVRTPVVALLSGEGGQIEAARELILKLGLGARVRLLGRLDDEALLAHYAHALGVFFGPYDEDYGYITLEAMLSSKPVITCTDSGGSLEFVRNGETGFVVEPTPQAVADAVDRLYLDRKSAKRMGRAGRDFYEASDIRWDRVVEALLA